MKKSNTDESIPYFKFPQKEEKELTISSTGRMSSTGSAQKKIRNGTAIAVRIQELEKQNAQLKKSMEQTTRELKERNTINNKFISIVAHDLKSPFNSILGFLNILKENIHELDKNTIETYVNHIFNSTSRAFHLLESLLEWSMLQKHEKTYNPVDLFLGQIISEEIENIAYLSVPKQIRIRQLVSPDLVITGDKQMLKTVIRNLLDNAVKFTNRNGKILISVSHSEKFVKVAVKDNGIGMSASTREKLFRKDTHFSTLGTDHEKGTGLGLLLCKEFVEMHGGKIGIESTAGRGSTFTFTLPITKEIK